MLSIIQSNTSSPVRGAICINVFCGADNPAAFRASPIAASTITAITQNTAAAPASSISACHPRRNPSRSANGTRLIRSPHQVSSSRPHSMQIPKA